MAYNKQNFQDGQILNAANLEAMENGIIAGQGVHNLLDNSDFTNPVNQSGAKTATLGKYFIDRWGTEPFPSGPSITIDSNGLTLLPTTSSTAGIYQQLPDYENRKGKVHTFAICVDNVWKCVSFTMGNFGVGYFIHGLAFFSVDNRNILIRNNASDTPVPITIQRVALYEGSYDASTLPSYVPKGKHIEMLNCGVQLNPRNLLDNSWWKKPKEIVNQRGETSKQGDWVYWIDRWLINATNAAVELRDGGIYLPATVDANLRILQRIPIETIDNGKAYTLAICESNGTIRCISGVYNNNYTGGDVIGDGSMYISIQPGEETYVYFIIDCYKNFTIRWAALYEGSYTASTFPAYQPKGYAAELAECQRYYQFIPEQTSCAFSTSAQSNKYFASSINFPQMRVTPTVSLKKDSDGHVGVVQGVAFVSASEFDFAYKLNGTLLPATTNANYAGKVMSFYGIELNADL